MTGELVIDQPTTHSGRTGGELLVDCLAVFFANVPVVLIALAATLAWELRARTPFLLYAPPVWLSTIAAGAPRVAEVPLDHYAGP